MDRQFPCGIPLGHSLTVMICLQIWEASWSDLPNPLYSKKVFQKSTWKCGRPDCPRAPGSLEQELLQILAAVETNTEQSLREHETRSTCEHNPEKNGPEITFCYKKLNTAGLPNALFVAFPCFLLFSNSIWIAFLFLASQLHKAENHLTQ